MGSSPVTATTPPAEILISALNEFFQNDVPLAAGSSLVVAFSGGPDSLALLWGLTQLRERQHLCLTAAHLDHGLDQDSGARRVQAERLALELGVPIISRRVEVAAQRLAGESYEAAARTARYNFLEEARRTSQAAVVATGHHLEDQAETLLLRLIFGSGWRGLVGIRRIHGNIVRPLLPLSKELLRQALSETGLKPVCDPTNNLPFAARNRIRHQLMPALLAAEPKLAERLGRIAARSAELLPAINNRLLAELNPVETEDGLLISRAPLIKLPLPLTTSALAALHASLGAPYPATLAAAAELTRQLGSTKLGCDCGRGYRWESYGSGQLLLLSPRSETRPFSYTFRVPGEVRLPEAGLSLRLERGPAESWMFKPWPHRVGLSLPVAPGERVEVRSRLAGDRLRPFGHHGSSRLKLLLIDRKVPRQERDRLPLLVVGGNIVWVPGVTVDDRCRVEPGAEVWIAELRPL